MAERTNLLDKAVSHYGEDIALQVVADYRETVGRYATEATFARFAWEVSGIYEMQDKLDGRHPHGNYEIVKSILEDIAMGEGAGLVMHYETDFSTLSKKLKASISEPSINFSAVLCPDWGWHMESDTLVYDMSTLNDGISKTAERTFGYFANLSHRAEYYQRPITFTGIFSGWELTRKEYFDEINGGVNAQIAQEFLEKTREKTSEMFAKLNSQTVKTNIMIAAPTDFHDLAALRTKEILSEGIHRRSLDAVLAGRQGFYDGSLTKEGAALELAEAQLGFQLASANHENILIIPTSPTIARASMSGKDIPFIQLKHGYRG